MPTTLDRRVHAVRRFTRFYTTQIGLLDEALYDTPLSLSEARVIYELAHRDDPTASTLVKDLGIDPGYLSRMLRGLRKQGLVDSRPAPTDARHQLLRLTRKGRAVFARIDARSQADVAALMAHLPAAGQQRLVDAMSVIETLLDLTGTAGSTGVTGGEAATRAGRADAGGRDAYRLRPPQPGDYGWVVRAHGALYAAEHGYNEEFEGLVARVVGAFVERFDAARERAWIAERDGEPVGSVFLVRKSATVAKLRLLIVDPGARGLGLGRRLVDECVQFARACGYRKVTLWTHSQLHAARGIYQAAGFARVAEAPSHSFGLDLVDETWELVL